MPRAALLLALLPGSLLALQTTPSLTVDPHVRSSVRAFDTTVYPLSSGIAIAWTGSTATCTVGSESQAFRDAAVLRLNYYRRLVGLPDVGEETAASAKCARAALMMAANGTLSHTPPNSWNCWTQDGYDAAYSGNIAFRSPSLASGQAIDQYIDDAGSNNTAVGHRRWLFYPPLANVGVGDTPTYNTTWVIERSGTPHTTIWGSRPPTPRGIAWPYAGYFPIARLPSSTRWSHSINGADLGGASISVRTDAGASLTTTKETYATGYGDNTLVWKVSGVDASSPGTGERPYHVLLRGITGASGRAAVHYSVLLFDTAQTRSDEARPTATVAATTASCTEGGAAGVFTVTLASAAARDTWINYALGGTAGTSDFTPSGALKIAQGATSGTLQITPLTDAVSEAAGESVLITLDPGAGYTLGAGGTSATVMILDPGAPVDTTPPATPAAPTVTAGTTADKPVFSGTTEGNALVRIYDGGVQIGTVSANGAGAWSWTPGTGLATGNHTITVRAEDGSGNLSAVSPSVVVTVPGDTTPPPTPAAPTIAAGAGTATPTLAGTTEANAQIRVYDGGAQIATVTADGAGAWTWTPSSPLAAGTHAITVRARDADGNLSAASPATSVVVPSTGSGGGITGGGSSSSGGGGGCGAGSAIALLGLLGLLLVRFRRE